MFPSNNYFKDAVKYPFLSGNILSGTGFVGGIRAVVGSIISSISGNSGVANITGAKPLSSIPCAYNSWESPILSPIFFASTNLVSAALEIMKSGMPITWYRLGILWI